MVVDAGASLSKTHHFKPCGQRNVEPQTIQRACARDEDIINAKMQEEYLLTPTNAKQREDWINE